MGSRLYRAVLAALRHAASKRRKDVAVPGISAAAGAGLLQVTQTFACRKNATSVTGVRNLLAIQSSFPCLDPGFSKGTAYLPGMQYRTGGAMAATAPSREKPSRLLIGPNPVPQ